jgi:hypothetical protein
MSFDELVKSIEKIQKIRHELLDSLDDFIKCDLAWSKAPQEARLGSISQTDSSFSVVIKKEDKVQILSTKVDEIQYNSQELQAIWPEIRIYYRSFADSQFLPIGAVDATSLLKVQKFETRANLKFFERNPVAKLHYTKACNRYKTGGFPDLLDVQLACVLDSTHVRVQVAQVPASLVSPASVPFTLNPLVSFALGTAGLVAQVYMQSLLRDQQRWFTERSMDSAQEAPEPPSKTPRAGEEDSPNSGGLN